MKFVLSAFQLYSPFIYEHYGYKVIDQLVEADKKDNQSFLRKYEIRVNVNKANELLLIRMLHAYYCQIFARYQTDSPFNLIVAECDLELGIKLANLFNHRRTIALDQNEGWLVFDTNPYYPYFEVNRRKKAKVKLVEKNLSFDLYQAVQYCYGVSIIKQLDIPPLVFPDSCVSKIEIEAYLASLRMSEPFDNNTIELKNDY